MDMTEILKGERYNVKLHAGGGIVDAEYLGRFGTEFVFAGPDGGMRSFLVMSVREIVPALDLSKL